MDPIVAEGDRNRPAVRDVDRAGRPVWTSHFQSRITSEVLFNGAAGAIE
jgi:hypothetical protein